MLVLGSRTDCCTAATRGAPAGAVSAGPVGEMLDRRMSATAVTTARVDTGQTTMPRGSRRAGWRPSASIAASVRADGSDAGRSASV